uniref:Uncharacterized protein n=1 Tax=Stomoxys calcitrans TaxID=35570 RepID=A0A1I8PLM2_STOCA|nr:unnamed protein product [Stomoxys calcitrans]
MALQANNRNLLMRNERTMPAWVTEQSGRIGPKPPPLPPGATENGHASPQKQPALPPKNSAPPEPDYEVIEFSNQQYSNAPLRPSSASSGSKTPDTKLKCTLCGSGNPWVMCEECSKQIFCASCDDMFHKHPKRKTHQRKALEQSIPPLPPKLVPGQPGPTPPVAPPRRNKRGFMTPLMQRKDQVNSSAGGHFGAVPPSPTPSMRNSSWHDRVGSLKRGLSMSILNRPLPETPKTPTTPSESSRCTTPKSAFDNIQRPPSVVLEKIKNKASATLDRMQLLQQRYRQQKEQMERERSGSINDQNLTAFDQWSSISPSPSHFRSGSMSSGINSSHLDLTDDSSFNLFHQRQMALQHHKAAAQRANQLGQRGMSSSVFNLNQPNRKPPPMNNGWMQNPMQQAQSMAQLNCSNCGPSPQNPWGAPQHMHMTHDPWSNQLSSQQQLNRSNLSLNVGPGYMMPHQHHNGMYPPPVFMTQRGVMGQMYPQGYMGGMPVMNPGLAGMPPSVSRAASRAGSRMGSPALSRKSVTLRRKQRSSYRDDEGTDDEDSDEDDRRSMVSNRSAMSRSRQRRMSSASQIQMDEDVADSSSQQRSRVRSQRRDSIAKSVHNDWAPGRKPSTNNRSVDSGFNSPRKPSRIYSDLDSEGSGTRALVQAKIEQKLKEESMKQQKQGKSKQKQEKPEKPKQTTSVQTAAAAAVASKTKAAKQQVEKVVEKEKTPTASESEEEEEEEMQQEQKQEEKKVPQQPEEESVEESEAEETKDQETQPQQNGHATPEHEAGATEDEDAVLLGPPPSTPDQEWECEFCTFVNEPNTKICIICCKTPSKPPKLVGKAVSPPPKQEKPADKGSESGTAKKETPSVKGTSKTTKKTQPSASTSLNVSSTSSSNVVVVDSSENSETPQSTTKTLKKKESLEDIWATLDENIQTTASEVTRKAETTTTQKSAPTKVSTGCGTSTKSPSVERPQEEPINKTQAREIGTSPPPPQTISTQTYEPLPLRKSETKEESPLPNGTRAPPNHDSLQPHNFPPTNKIQDLKSFETEVLQNIHNISHIPSPYQYQPLPQQHNHHHQQSYYAPQDRHQRYRSNNDLRMDDAMSLDYDSYNGMGGMGGMGRRHPSISELLLLQRESDLYKYTTEELNAALKYCGPDMHPLVWLRDNWPKLIQTVQSLATKYGQERAENTIGTISQMEAREALRLHTGNIWQAVSECIEQRQRKYREISSRGNFSREDVVTALTTHQGNVEAALLDLGRTQLKPFLMRIWGSPGGVENESGAIMLPPASPQSPLNEPYAMDKDIHNFLSANASDCMQIPNASAAFTPTTTNTTTTMTNNQTPSPFDLPASMPPNTYDLSHTPLPDNSSNYSADSNKDFGASPLPIDDSILNNKHVLKDLEALIGTMEQNQQKQSEHVLRSIKDMIHNLRQDKSDMEDYDMESMRILTKSPITTQKYKQTGDKNAEGEADVKNFVWQHIQEIVPNLVQQVEMELLEDSRSQKENSSENQEEVLEESNEEAVPLPPPPPPVDQDEFLMEEVIKPNLKNASIREEVPPQYLYTAEIAPFQLAFDKALHRDHRPEIIFDTLRSAIRQVFKMFQAPEAPAPAPATEPKPLENTTTSTMEWPEPPLPTVPAAQQTREMSTDIELQIPLPAVPSIAKLPTQTSPKVVNNSTTTTAADQPLVGQTVNLPETSGYNTSSPQNQSPELLQQTATAVSSTPEPHKTETQDTQTATEVASSAVRPVEQPTKIPSAVLPEKDNTPQDTNVVIGSTMPENTQYQIIQEVETNATIIPTGMTLENTSEQTPKDTEKVAKEGSVVDETPSVDNSGAPTSETNEEQQIISLEPKAATQTPNATSTLEISEEVQTTNSAEIKSELLEMQEIPSSQTMNEVTTEPLSSEIQEQQLPLSSKDMATEPQSTALASQETVGISEEAPPAITVPSSSTESQQTNVLPLSTSQSSEIPTINVEAETQVQTSTNKKPLTAGNQKKTSKIPVRRTISNNSLILNSVKSTQPQELPIPSPTNDETSFRSLTPDGTDLAVDDVEDSEEEELYSLQSDESDIDSRADDMVSPTDTESRLYDLQSPTSTNEMFLMIHNGMESGMEESTIVPSTSSSTIHSAISFVSGLKSPTEFIPSGDPSKQNLSELVKDTQRLIQQMRDEIQIEEFESSTDEDDYTDDYYDDYDDEELGEEEEYYEEGGDEEQGVEDDEGEWEDDIEEGDEYAEVIGDMTEEDVNDDQQDQRPQSTDQTSEPGHREEHNTSVLSNTSESSTHSQSQTSEHFVDKSLNPLEESNQNLTINSNLPENTAVFVETERSETEIVVASVDSKESPTAAYVETENALPELPVETVLEENLPLPTATTESAVPSASIIIESLPLTIANEMESENSLPELPSEIVLSPVTQTLPLQTENTIPELPVEVVLQSTEKIVDTPSSQTVINQTTNDSSTSISASSLPTPSIKDHEIPSTSNNVPSSLAPKEETIPNKVPQESNLDENKASTSKQATKQSKTTASKKKASEEGKTTTKKAAAASKIPKPKDNQKEQKPKAKETQKEQKPKEPAEAPKPKEAAPTPREALAPKKKLPTRSKSFSGPPTPIGITSVKTITQRFQTVQKSSNTQAAKPPTTIARKPSITEAINKLTKPSTSSQLPTTSSLFRARTQPRIPKKKYHETCFSDDDYETTSSEEEPEPLEIRQRKMSVPVFRAYPSLQEPEDVKTEELVNKFVKEELVNTFAEAQIAAALISMKFPQDVSLWAAKECSDLDHAVALLKQDCELCSGTYALNEIVSMLKCTHKCCKQCAKTYFTVQITERSINDCNCPFCKMPELHNQTEYEDDNLEYFSNLDIFLKSIVEPDVHELFQRKLRDRTLLKDPNFKWCVQCSSGFFARPKQKRLICPDCGSVTCAFCRKTWQKEHEGISCEKFLEWEKSNDPDVPDIGVQQHLEQNGIDCPKCKFRYSLARGGCMHFTCTQCKFEFCYGCAKPFMMGAKCTISPYCAKLGLHAHHPRNCLFYLRDKLPVQLQILLKNNGIAYDVDAVETNDENEPSTSGSAQKLPALCPIPIQKETPNGLVDTKCKNDVPEKHAGMCRTHYVEYLTAKVAKANIDPLPIFDLTDCVQELRRRGIPLPDRGPWDTDEIYKTMCAEVIQKHIPLDIN